MPSRVGWALLFATGADDDAEVLPFAPRLATA
jgi:hypothetical protein